MKKKYIINKKSEIDSLFNSKNRRGNSYFVIFNKKDGQNINFRFAMSIGRKYGNAVERNKIKRQIRSIIRNNKEYISNNSNFVIVIRPKAKSLTYKEIEENLVNLLKKLK